MAKTSEPQALSVLWHQVLESTEQMLALGETHATMLSAAALVLLTSLLIACAFREHCRGAAVQEYIYSRLPLLHREDEEGQANSLWWERLSIAKELLLQLADITTDLSWSGSMLSKGHITFGVLNILIIVVASVARFSMERLEWKQAGFDEDVQKFIRQQDVHGNRKPRKKQHKHKLFGPDFPRTFLTLTPGCPGVKKFLPITAAAENVLFGADVHDFRRGRP